MPTFGKEVLMVNMVVPSFELKGIVVNFKLSKFGMESLPKKLAAFISKHYWHQNILLLSNCFGNIRKK